jgi:cell shape-determining protein MreC
MKFQIRGAIFNSGFFFLVGGAFAVDGNWAYYQTLTSKSDILLSADVNNEHAILVDVNSSNTAFWQHIYYDQNDEGKRGRYESGPRNAEYKYGSSGECKQDDCDSHRDDGV